MSNISDMSKSAELLFGSTEPYGPDLEDEMRSLTQLISESETTTLAEIKNVSKFTKIENFDTNFVLIRYD